MNRSLQIVVADDEPVLRDYLVRILPRLGHRAVAAAANGRELVELCRAERPDLVITDICMPELDGLEAAAAIYRETPVPIVFVSAHHDPQMIAKAAKAFVMAYLVKPITQQQLGTAIEETWERFERERPVLTEARSSG